MFGNQKAKKEIRSKAIVEGENIFKKLNPQYAKTGFPKVTAENANTPYGRAAMSVQKQVTDTRMKQYKSKKK
ncbi:MAG: hypothetical protein WCN88_04745 [Candidatus Falkowbacteria bacterium]